MSDTHKLSTEQKATLFHFLCQEEALLEFTSLKIPGRIAALGRPFLPNSKYPDAASSPLLERCVRHFVLTETLPGFSQVKDDSKFWGSQVQGILERMAESNLSDSYDKGKVSKRKTLGMAVSVFLSNIARGLFGKIPTSAEVAVARAEQGEKPYERVKRKEDLDARSLLAEWQAWKRDMVHEDHLETILTLIKDSVPCEEWPIEHYPAALYVKLTIASLLHYIFVASLDGPDILSILSRLHEKIPYWTIRQSLKIPYAPGMISGLSKMFLAKSMFGKSNLMQSLISYILGGDQSRLEKSIAEIEKASPSMNPTYKSRLDSYVYHTAREQQTAWRNQSMKSGQSIVAIILGTTQIDDAEHQILLKYLELQLARRDRVELINILTGDDTLTSLVRTVLDIFFGIISELHKAVDLPTGLGAAQSFIGALIACSEKPDVTLGDFIELVDRYECEFIKFGHQILRNSSSLTSGYTEWYHHCLTAYRGDPVLELEMAIAKMDESKRKGIIAQIDAYRKYLEAKESDSEDRLENMLRARKSNSASDCQLGFGSWLSILQDVQLDARVTPQQPQGVFEKALQPEMDLTRQAMMNVFASGLSVQTK
jgi:hypothetical protein